MYLKRNSKDCNIYNRFFIDDLQQYQVVEDVTIDTDSTLYLKMMDGDNISWSTCYIRSDDLLTVINSNQPDSPYNNVWLPAILDTPNYMSTKEILMGHVVDNTVYGIENMISCSNPVFQNWTITARPTANKPSIDIDWKINSNLSPAEIFYGVLFWYKLNTNPSSATTYKLKELPNGSKIYCTQQLSYTDNSQTYTLPANQVVIKKNNSLLQLIKETEVIANNNREYFEFSKVSNLAESRIFKSFGLYNSISSSLKDYTLWISSGEAFSYYNGFRDRYKRDTKGTLSRSYISPGLYPIYRSIYNALTIRQNKNSSGSGLTKKQSAKLKKLCYFLASSPLIDRTTINYLTSYDLYNTIYSSYINAGDGVNEKKDLLNIINTIFYRYKNMSLDLDQQTSGHNIIKTKSDLFLKLSKKYCPYIKILPSTTSCKFKYNSALSNGAHAYFNFGISSHVASPSTGTTIFNNFDLNLGNISLQTNNSATNSECKFYYIEDDDSRIEMTPAMPLSDIGYKRPDKVKIDLGNDASISMGTSFEKTHIIPPISSTDSTDTDTFWFLSEGKDCLRFSDYARFPGPGASLVRVKTSNQTSPDIFVKQTGLFSVDCVHSQSNALKKTDTIDIYVNGGTALNYPANPAIVNEYKSMCPNIRQIAINKRGLVWFVDTDMHVHKMSTSVGYEAEERCIDTKISFEYFTKEDANGDRIANIYNSNAELDFILRPNNTTMKLTHLSIEHLRDRDAPITQNGETKTVSLADCKSCYEEKIARERDTIFGPTIGAARYYRLGPNDGVSFYKYKTDNNIDWYKSSELVEFKMPTASTAFAPRIPSYGGYSQEVIKNIGVDIPYHPISVNGVPLVNRQTPNNTIWDCPSGFSCSDPAYMPSIIDRNDMGGVLSNRRCRLVDIPVTGCTTFTKGYFSTESGWIPHESSAYGSRMNKSSVQKYQTDNYESYIFKGYGYTDLKSAFDLDHSTNLKNRFKSAITINSSYASVGSSEHSSNYGYRNPNMTILQETDDFVVYEDTESRVDFDCAFVPNISYSFINSSQLSSLKIKDLEVRLNFINYPNPKQLIVYLDVTYSSTSPVTSDPTNKIFKNYLSTGDLAADTPAGFQNYYNAIVSMNTWVGVERLYLLNRDNIDNYGYNFSLCFSDNVGINHVTTDYNKITTGPSPSQYIINNGDKIRPTLSPFGYNDGQIAEYRNVLANNNMSIYEASFAKFRNIPLAGTKFTLNVEVVDQHDNITVKDNLKNNNDLSGLTNIEHKETSNNIANSICSWEVIVHTKNTTKFVPSDVLGYINYNNPSNTYDGYSFIADLTDKQYMVPPVNLNAPFPYMSNINSCKFIDDYEMSRSMTYQQIQYPTTFLFFTPFFSAVGGLVAISQLQAVFGAGGRADPIVNMFMDLRFQRMQEELERNYFQPVYDGYGYANKAIILASKDKATWYQMEVPIFKLSNCPVLQKNRYKYIKLKKNMALGRFIVKRVKDIKEIIDMSEITTTITADPATLSGLTITTDNGTSISLKAGDLVHVKNSTINEVYAVEDGAWVAAPNTKSTKFCAYNKAIKNNTLTKAYVSSRQLFIVEGARAYYYFDKNDNIDMTYLNSGSSANNTIIDKALLLINGEYKTVLTLGTTVNAEIGEIAKPDGDVNTILIYKDHVTRNDNIKVGKWSTDKSYQDKALNFQIDRHPAVFGEGSIGYGTNQLEPDLFGGVKLKYNSIQDTDQILDGNNSNKFRYNTVTVNGADITFDPAVDDPEDLLYGYSYSLFDFGLHKPEALIQKDIFKQEDIDRIKAIIGGNVLISHNNKTPLFMDLKSDKFKDIDDYGEIIINRDFNAKISSYYVSSSKRGVIALRIAKLIDLIASARAFYANMPDDPKECNSVDGINTECPKKDKLQEIQSYSSEKDFLRSLLSNSQSSNSWSSQTVTFTPALSDSLTSTQVSQAFQLMNIKNELSTKSELLIALGITEEDYDSLIALAPNTKINASFRDKDYYWINIDKEQYCSIAQEASAKVLKKVTYRCSPIVEYYQYPACNSVCGNGYSKDIKGTDENIKQDTSEMEYTISAAKVAEEKAKYPNVTDWVDSTQTSSGYYVFEKKFFMSCSDDTNSGDDSRDTLVTVKEYYEFPTKPNPASYKVKDVFNLDGDNTVYIKFKNIPRKLKTIDPIYTLYNYDYKGNLGKSTTPSPGGPISNNFCVWQCYGFDDDKPQPDGHPFYGKIIEPPDFYKLQNEMIFRAFFGSVDGTEHKNTNISNTKEMWEWIPYEYFNKPIIEGP